MDATCTNIESLTVIAGPNGVGKSTLLEILTKAIRGENVANCQIENCEIMVLNSSIAS
jgi:ABC-type cobalamin/Fe3+-siderophores transport system ATPase subunit